MAIYTEIRTLPITLPGSELPDVPPPVAEDAALPEGPADVVLRIPPGPGEVLVRSGARILVRWAGGSFQLGEGIDADPLPDGVRLRTPERDP